MFKNISIQLLSLLSFFVVSILNISTIYADDIKVHSGIRWIVFQNGLPRVDNLAMSPMGELFATLELGQGRGQLVSIYKGKITPLIKELSRPDGLAFSGGKLFVTEEVSRGRVLQYHLGSRESKTLLRLDKPEGIVVLPDGSLLITLDLKNGRLVRLSPENQLTEILNGLSRPEGLRVGPDSTVYIAETGSGRVIAFKDGNVRVVVDNLNEPDQLAIDAKGALWIAEDADPGRILRVVNGATETMISGLASPQGMIFDQQGRLYVAEQGNNRILRFTFQGQK